MMRFVEVVKHYPGQQQVNLSVEIEVPGSWFGGTEMGSLNAGERRQKYKAQAVEYAEVREFPGATARARKVKAPAIRFICLDDQAGTRIQTGIGCSCRSGTGSAMIPSRIVPTTRCHSSWELALQVSLQQSWIPAAANRGRAARSNKSSHSSVRVFMCRKTTRKSHASIGPARRRTASKETYLVIKRDLPSHQKRPTCFPLFQCTWEADQGNAQGYRPPLPPP